MFTKNIERQLYSLIHEKMFMGKAIILLGPRQTGKTTLLKELTSSLNQPIQWLNCDEPAVREILEGAGVNALRRIIGTKKILVIDEAQRVKNIGLTMKLITDELTDVQLLVSGSSSLELANEINEPLTGRKWEYFLYPISWMELVNSIGYLEARLQLESRIIFGMYPEVVTNAGSEKQLLTQLAGSYLYKDLLSFRGIRKPELLDKLLKALALQLGQEVSFNELSTLLQVDKNTVSEYIRLLEEAFIITRLQPLSRNLRNEISSTRKIYFWDTGIRNAILSNYTPLSGRNDAGALWENFMIAERMKYTHYKGLYNNRYFWRTRTQQEIDYIEERDGKFFAFEFKINPKKNIRSPKSFMEAYKDASFHVISRDNFTDILTT